MTKKKGMYCISVYALLQILKLAINVLYNYFCNLSHVELLKIWSIQKQLINIHRANAEKTNKTEYWNKLQIITLFKNNSTCKFFKIILYFKTRKRVAKRTIIKWSGPTQNKNTRDYIINKEARKETKHADSHTYNLMEVHKVVAPPRRSTAAKLKTRLKETFFPDDPLRQFRGQPNRTKLIRAAQYIFPILQWCPEYSFRLLKSDAVSGLTIASLAIPQVRNSFSGERVCKIRR